MSDTSEQIDMQACTVPRQYPALWDTSRYLILYGGAGSGKSVFASQKVVLRCLHERHRFMLIRKIGRTLRDSMFAEIKARLSEWGIYDLVRINTTEMSIKFPNGSEIIFKGLDDMEKLKSISGVTSIWIEEATELSEAELNQIDLRLRGETPGYKQVMLTFNPISATHWLKKRFFDKSSDKASIIKSTFADNPFIDDEYKEMLADLAGHSPDMYRVYGEGEWGILKGLIFNPPVMLETFPEEFDMTAYGMDFGFNDPSTIIYVGFKDIDWKRRVGSLYVREVLYQTKLTNAQLGDRMRACGVEKMTAVYADSAEPARIAELARQGFRVLSAVKGKGSLLASISLLQGMTIYTHAANTNFNLEMASYTWDEDKHGESLDQPIGTNDHAIAALRYAVYSTMKKRVNRVEVA
jgi:phage terminase large subunit